MKNIYILYIPTGNAEAILHYSDTIKNKVNQDRIFEYADDGLKTSLKGIFGNKPIATWGSRDGSGNRSRYENMQQGDDILIVEGDTIKLLGKIANKTINHELSKHLWKNYNGPESDGWDLIYFIANPLEIDLPFREFNKLFGYGETYLPRGFTSVAEEKLKEFYSDYDDLYSVLERIKNGDGIFKLKRKEIELPIIGEEEKVELTSDDVVEILSCDELSDHVKMQYKLIKLGMKSGSKVWIPKNDQSKIRKEYDFNNFEEEFTSGIDAPTKYIDNIDVVWKEEFLINAAFEIENSTSIYSGLLRFSDLKIVAPNSNYPLFIVAPKTKRNRLIEQVKRPTFKKLEFQNKVKYLSYETVDEIDKFFGNSKEGLNAEVLSGRAESIN